MVSADAAFPFLGMGSFADLIFPTRAPPAHPQP